MDKEYIGYIGSSYITGVVLGTLIFPRLADIYGRKKVFYIGLSIYLTIVGFLLTFTNLYLYYFFIFLMGLGLPARFMIGYVYLNELIPTKYSPYIASLGLFFIS